MNNYENGAKTAAAQLGLKIALNLGTAIPAVKNFVAGQLGHAQSLGRGVRDMASFGTGNPAARDEALRGLKGLAPTLGGAAALGTGAYLLGGDKRRDDQGR